VGDNKCLLSSKCSSLSEQNSIWCASHIHCIELVMMIVSVY